MPFCPFHFKVSLLNLNSRNLIINGLLGNLVRKCGYEEVWVIGAVGSV